MRHSTLSVLATAAVVGLGSATATATTPPAGTAATAGTAASTGSTAAPMAAQFIVGGAGHDLCPLLDGELARAAAGKGPTDAATAIPKPLYELASASGMATDGNPHVEGGVQCDLQFSENPRQLRVSLLVVTDDQLRLSGATGTVADRWAADYSHWGDPLPGLGDAAVFSASPDYVEISAMRGSTFVDGFLRRADMGDPEPSKMAIGALVAATLEAVGSATGGSPVTMPEWKPAVSLAAPGGVDLCDVPIDLVAKAARVTPADLDPPVAVHAPRHALVAGCEWTLKADSGPARGDAGHVVVALFDAPDPAEASLFIRMIDVNAAPTPGLGDGAWHEPSNSEVVVKVGDQLLEVAWLNDGVKMESPDNLTPIAQLLVPKL